MFAPHPPRVGWAAQRVVVVAASVTKRKGTRVGTPGGTRKLPLQLMYTVQCLHGQFVVPMSELIGGAEDSRFCLSMSHEFGGVGPWRNTVSACFHLREL